MIKCFLPILVFSIATTGCWGCKLLDIGVATSKTGNTVAGKPEWAVVITNRCNCPVAGISLSCPEFDTVKPVDPSIMVRSGDGRCLINHGGDIAPGSSVQFTYAWDSSFSFAPRDFNPSWCWGCKLLDIGVATSMTGRKVAGKPEWAVVITNRCSCPVAGISLTCPKFNTVEPVNPTIMVRSGDGRCLINHGAPIAAGHSVRFSYAWDSAFSFAPRDFNPSCKKHINFFI